VGRTGSLGNLFGERVGHRLGDESLPATRWAVEQDSLRGVEVVFAEELRVQVGKLDRVADLLELFRQAPDVLVADIRNLFEDQLLYLGLRQTFEYVPRLCIHEQAVAGADLLVQERVGKLHDSFLVGAGDHQRSLAVLENLLEGDDLALNLELVRSDDVERLVEHDLLTAAQLLELDLG